MSALSRCEGRLNATELVWEWAQEARIEARLVGVLAAAEIDPQRKAQLEQERDVETSRADALAESALVRVVTAWEVFLRDLIEEYLTKRPQAFQNAWGLTGSADRMMAIVDKKHGAFQDPGNARKIFKTYVAKKLFEPELAGWAAVLAALECRHAIIHAGGTATIRFQEVVKTALPPRDWLHSKPQTAPLPGTEFERVLGEVRSAVTQLDERVWKTQAP